MHLFIQFQQFDYDQLKGKNTAGIMRRFDCGVNIGVNIGVRYGINRAEICAM